MRGVELPFGLRADGRMVSIAEVESGLACQCVCAACGVRLVAKKGDQVTHHFAHEADADCPKPYETMLHKLGKQMVLDAGGVKVPALVVRYLGRKRVIYPERWIFFDHVEKEVRWPGFQPDIVARRLDRELAVEIKVAHACGPEKIEIVRASGLAMIEIDLSHLSRIASEDQIRKAVLNKAPRSWLFNPRLAEHQAAFIEEVSEALERERDAAFYAAAHEGMQERQAAAAKAALAVAKQPRIFNASSYRFLIPKKLPTRITRMLSLTVSRSAVAATRSPKSLSWSRFFNVSARHGAG